MCVCAVAVCVQRVHCAGCVRLGVHVCVCVGGPVTVCLCVHVYACIWGVWKARCLLTGEDMWGDWCVFGNQQSCQR